MDIGKVRDFSGVLSDVSNLRGIFATRSGYQSGAIVFAKAHGIELRIIREPEEQDYDWKQLDLKYLAPYAKVLWKKLSVVPDFNWYEASDEQLGEPPAKKNQDIRDIFLADMILGTRKTMFDLRKELSVSAQRLVVGQHYTWVFPNTNEIFENTWLHFSKESSEKPIKIQQLHVPYVVEKGFWVIELVQATDNHHVVVKDALKDEHTFYNKEGKETGKKFRY